MSTTHTQDFSTVPGYCSVGTQQTQLVQYQVTVRLVHSRHSWYSTRLLFGWYTADTAGTVPGYCSAGTVPGQLMLNPRNL